MPESRSVFNTDALARASAGICDVDRVCDLEPFLVKKYFDRTSKNDEAPIKVKPTLRDLVTFRKLNLQDPL